MTNRDIEKLYKRPDLLVQTPGNTFETRKLLSRFIEEIQIHSGRAVIRYSISLPDDSPLAGMMYQEVEFTPGLIA